MCHFLKAGIIYSSEHAEATRPAHTLVIFFLCTPSRVLGTNPHTLLLYFWSRVSKNFLSICSSALVQSEYFCQVSLICLLHHNAPQPPVRGLVPNHGPFGTRLHRDRPRSFVVCFCLLFLRNISHPFPHQSHPVGYLPKGNINRSLATI